MTLISYAQNFEDVMLWRALKHVENGFYIDIGAQDPVVDSVSLTFYEHGWRGIHVEPVIEYVNQLAKARPDEIVIPAAVGKSTGLLTFFIFPDTGLSTADPGIARRHKESGFQCVETKVPVISLDEIFATTNGRQVHWLKLDVEGMEKPVIQSWRKSVVKPWILLIESTLPLTQERSHHQWEQLITAHGYEFVYFDGLNCYYVSHEHPELKGAFAAGPNLFDGFHLSSRSSSPFCTIVEVIHESNTQPETQLYHCAVKMQSLSQELHQRDSQVDVLSQDLADREMRLQELSQELGERDSTLAALSQDLAEREMRLQELSQEFGERDSTLAVLSQDLADREMRLQELSQELGERDSTLAVLSQDLADREGRLQELSQELGERDNTLAALSQDLAEREGRLQELSQELGERDSTLAELSQDLAERERRLQELSQELGERDSTLALLSQDLAEREMRLQELSQELSEREAAIAALTETVRERDIKLERLADELLEREANIDSLTKDVRERDTRIDQLSHELADQVHAGQHEAHRWWFAHDQLRAQLDVVENSRAWKVMLVLRKIYHIPAWVFGKFKRVSRSIILQAVKKVLILPSLRCVVSPIVKKIPFIHRRLYAMAMGEFLLHNGQAAPPEGNETVYAVIHMDKRARRVFSDLKQARGESQ